MPEKKREKNKKGVKDEKRERKKERKTKKGLSGFVSPRKKIPVATPMQKCMQLYTKKLQLLGTTASRVQVLSRALSLDNIRKILFSRPGCCTPCNFDIESSLAFIESTIFNPYLCFDHAHARINKCVKLIELS